MMSKTFHGKIDETVDALIIFEACRQGVMPRITRRLLSAERGETRPLPNPPSEASFSTSTSSSSSTRMSSRLSVSAPATTASISSSFIPSVMAYSSSSSSSATPSPSAATSSSPTTTATTIPSLIIPGSVFVFDEEESGICRWTDGKIWSPSRICDNFLVYRELYRKLPNQKCYTTSDKAKMKDGSGLKDQALKEKVEKENLVVIGCMKGTFVLKKGGLVKKTICVQGINLIPPAELKRRLEGPALGLASSSSSSGRRGGRAGGGGRGRGGGNRRNILPGFSTRGTQHLVCYEMPGEMDELHGPREYLELRDLPISKTFVMMQSYRIPIQILPLDFGQQPLDPADEYIHSSRILEARATRHSTSLASSNTADEEPFKRRKARGSRQRKLVEEEVEEGESEDEPEYLVNGTNSNSSDDYYGSRMMTSSGPIITPVAPPPPPHPSSVAPVYHNYPTRGQDRYIREQMRQQLMEPLGSSMPTESTPKDKKRKVPLSRSLTMEPEDTLAVKVEKSSPSLGFTSSVGHSGESGGFLQHGLAVEGGEMSGNQYGAASGMPSSSLATRGAPNQMHELLQSMNTIPLHDDNELKVHGYKTAEREWRLATSSRNSAPNWAITDPLAYARSTYNPGHTQLQPVNVYPYHESPHWEQQDPSYSPQPRSWDLVAYNQMNSRRTHSGLYPLQQLSMKYNEPQPQLWPQDGSQYHSPSQQQGFSNETATYYNGTPASTTMMLPQDLQGYYSPHAGAGHYGQPLPTESDTTSAAASHVIQNAGDTDLEHSDDAGYSPMQQPSPRAEREDSPWSSGSIYSRSSSLSTSLTLSPVVGSQVVAGQDDRFNTGSETENQPFPVAMIANERQNVGGMHALTDIRLWHDDEPSYARPKVVEQVQLTLTAASSSSQCQTASVSFTHTARSSSTFIAPKATPISVQAAEPTPTPTPVPLHIHGSAFASTSVAYAVDAGHHDNRLLSPSEANPLSQHQPLQATSRTFHRRSLPYVPVMAFSSEVVLGTCAVDSRQGSPMTSRKEAMRSGAPGPKFQAPLVEAGANETLMQEQKFVTDGGGRCVEPYFPQVQESPTSKPPTQSSNEAIFTSAGTTPAMIASHQVQRSYYSAAGSFGERLESSPLSQQRDSEPYSPQPRREHMHLPSFLFQDLDERDELDRLLDYQSQQMNMLGHDGGATEGHEDGGGRLRETGEYDGLGDSESTVEQTISPPVDARTDDEPQPSGSPRLMSPRTLSALHHYSQDGVSCMRGDSCGPPIEPIHPTAPSLSMVSSNGSLGQDEYLLHQNRPHISKHIRQQGYGASMGIGTSFEIGFGSSEGYGRMPGSGGGDSNRESKSNGAGTGAGTDAGGQYDRSEDLPWAMSRQEDTTSSEIACQLFSGLGPARGRGRTGEGHVYASEMGVGIGTTIGDSRGGVVHFEHGGDGSSGEDMNDRTQSVQTLKLSDPVDQYSFGNDHNESPTRTASPSSARDEEKLGEEPGYSPREKLLHGGCSHVANRLRMEDNLIDQVEVKEEDGKDDELEVLVLYSENSLDRSSPVQEHYDDDDGGEEDEDMGQGYDDRAQESDVDFTERQVGDRRDVGCKANVPEMLDELPGSQESTGSEN